MSNGIDSVVDTLAHMSEPNRLLCVMGCINTLSPQQYAQMRVMLLMQATKADWETLMVS